MADAPAAAEVEELSGPERAAVFLFALGDDAAAEVLKHLDPKEVQKLCSTMKALEDITRQQVEAVIKSFVNEVGLHTALGMDSDNYIRQVLVKALGEEKAGGLIDRIMVGGGTQGLETLKWMDARAVGEVIRDEHPQIKAIVLSYLDSDQAAAVLSLLPEKARADVLLRIATLDAVQPAALQELNDSLERRVAGAKNIQSTRVGGLKTAADMLNFMDGSLESETIEKVKEIDADLGQQIQDLMFVFDNLIDLDRTGVQALLREVSSDSLLLALKGADDEMREKFFSNMSKRAAEMLRDDLEAKGPVRVSEVEAAQKEILTIARRMADDGQIMLGGQGGEQFV